MPQPTIVDITRRRGDTTPIELSVTDENDVAVDVTGFSFALTVDPSDRPSDSTNNLFSVAGTITDGPNGLVEFPLTVSEANNVGGFFYDIQQTDAAGNDSTIAIGRFTFKQDITK